jgi:hypothetical protein
MKHPILALFLVLLCSCAEDVQETNESSFSSKGESHEGEKLEKRYKTNAMSGFKQDSEGHWITDSSKRSTLEAKGSNNMAGKQFNNKQLSKRDANLPAQWSRPEYAKPEYKGNTDGSALSNPYADASKTAREGGVFSAFRKKNVTTKQISGTSARETNLNNFPRTNESNASTFSKKFPEQGVIDYRQIRNMDIQQTKSIMGR